MTFQHLQHPIRWMFLLHALCGSVALGIFILPLVAKKGGSLHVRAGWIYSGAMAIVGLSAFVITPWRAFLDPERTTSSQAFAIFLAFVAVFTLASLWFGIMALKRKARTEPTRELALLGPPVVLAVSALAVCAMGVASGSWLLILFPLLGLGLARNQLRYWTQAPVERMHWWFAHMEGMFTACIATITAFLVTAVPRLTSAEYVRSPALWLAPGVILGFASSRWAEVYRAKFGAKKSS